MLSVAAPVKLIIDTDIQSDVDDVGALAVAHALADNGEAELLGVMVETSNAFNPRAVDAINTYYGRPNLPIGQWKGPQATPQDTPFPFNPTEQKAYQQLLAESFPNDIGAGDKVPNAVTLYRQLLAAQPDHSVVIASIGFLNVLSDLLDSKSDNVSTPNGIFLSGRDLISRKVKLLVVMGGYYPQGKDQFNFLFAPKAAGNVINTWPGRVVFSGLGEDVHTGPRLSRETPTVNPVRQAYESYLRTGSVPFRPSWDQIAVLAAVRGLAPYFTEAGTNSSNKYDVTTGSNSFIGNEDKEHSYLVQPATVTNEQLATALENLMAQLPVATTGRVYRLVSKSSGKVLQVPGCTAANATSVTQGTWTNADCQRWNFGVTSDGYDTLTAQPSAQRLDLAYCSGADGAVIWQYSPLNNDCQKWKVEFVGGGYFRLVAKSSGKVLDLANCSGADGAKVWQYRWLDNDCQKWRLETPGSGGTRIMALGDSMTESVSDGYSSLRGSGKLMK